MSAQQECVLDQQAIDQCLSAASKGNLRAVQGFVNRAGGVAPFVSKPKGTTLLMMAATSSDPENIELAKYLLEVLKVPLDEQDLSGDTALHIAARDPRDRPLMVEYLLYRRADPNARNKKGETPFHQAARGMNLGIFATFFQGKTRPNLTLLDSRVIKELPYASGPSQEPQGATVFDIACEIYTHSPARGLTMVTLILENGHRFRDGFLSKFYNAKGSPDYLNQLFYIIYEFQHGAHVVDGTLVSHSFSNCHLSEQRLFAQMLVVNRLARTLQVKGQVIWNCRNEAGNTALHCLYKGSFYKSASYLLLEGASIFIPDNKGQTIWDMVDRDPIPSYNPRIPFFVLAYIAKIEQLKQELIDANAQELRLNVQADHKSVDESLQLEAKSNSEKIRLAKAEILGVANRALQAFSHFKLETDPGSLEKNKDLQQTRQVLCLRLGRTLSLPEEAPMNAVEAFKLLDQIDKKLERERAEAEEIIRRLIPKLPPKDLIGDDKKKCEEGKAAAEMAAELARLRSELEAHRRAAAGQGAEGVVTAPVAAAAPAPKPAPIPAPVRFMDDAQPGSPCNPGFPSGEPGGEPDGEPGEKCDI